MTEQQRPRRVSRRQRVRAAVEAAAPEMSAVDVARLTDAVMRDVVIPLAIERDRALGELFQLRRAQREEERR